MNENPLVSIVVLNYNAGELLLNCIDSVKKSIHANLEIIVVDTILEYMEVINTEYVDCDTGLPCGSGISEIVDKSSENNVIYNLQGQAVKVREGLYIENGKIYYKTK